MVWTAQFHLSTDFFQWTPVLFSIHRWESANEESQPYSLIDAILYMGLEHLRILVSAWVLEPSHPPPPDTERQLNLGGFKIYMQIFDCTGLSTPNPCFVQGSTLQSMHCFWLSDFSHALKSHRDTAAETTLCGCLTVKHGGSQQSHLLPLRAM